MVSVSSHLLDFNRWLRKSRVLIHKVHRAILISLLIIFTIFSIVACHNNSPNTGTGGSSVIASEDSTQSTSRVVKHIMGETQVPTYPERVIVLDNAHLGNAIALGTIPIGAAIGLDQAYLRTYQSYLNDQTVAAPILVGNSTDPNLEKILSLKPGLILGFEYHQTIYEQLSQVVPTVLHDSANINSSWKELVKLSGEALGQAEEAEELLKDYYQRTQELRQRLEEQKNSKLSVSAVRVNRNSGIVSLLQDSFPGTIFQDVGLVRPSAQSKNGNLENISVELISQIDGDVLFVIALRDEKNSDLLSQLKQNPLWSQLQAVKQKRVYQVDTDRWLGYNIISANFVLDDLFKYLLEE